MAYFAKPSQCYACHIKAVYESWKKLYTRRGPVVKALCARLGINDGRFKAASLLTVAFHDAGKPARNFQSAMAAIRRKKESDNGETPQDICRTCNCSASVTIPDTGKTSYRHEIIGGMLAIRFGQALDQYIGGTILNGFPFEFFSIIGHHKPVNSNSFRREWDEFFGEAKELEKIGFGQSELHHVIEVAKESFEQEGIQFPTLDWNGLFGNGEIVIERVKEQIDTVPLVVQKEIDGFGSTKILGSIREIHAVLKSLLIAADWEGSSEQAIHTTLDLSVNNFWDKVKEEVEQESDKKFKMRKFQIQLSSLTGHGIAIAPTGSGKTEGAIAWALNQQKEYPGKVLYLLPTQVLTNSIYERLVKYLDPADSGIVGLLHHGALLYQIHSRLENDESDQYDPKPTKDEKYFHMLNQMMFRPVMVATVDQLLSLAFNGNKRWAVVMGELMGGTIIFDEVHAYDGHMLALLERVVRELRDSTPMLFMSATMPTNLQDFLSQLLGSKRSEKRIPIINAVERLNLKRNRFFDRTREKILDKKGKMEASIIEEIRSRLGDGKSKRTAIVCNTVKTAQSVYKQLNEKLKNVLNGEEDRMCFHSRFIAKDRRDKESRLEKDRAKSREEQSWPQVLVATQVIECGLDIDYDVLYTEGAPVEAIIQRAGRVNREGSPAFGEVYVYKQDEDSQKFYPPEITEKGLALLKKKIKKNPLISEKQFVQMVEEIYTGRKFEDDPRFLNTRRILDELMYDIGAIQDLPETDLHTRFVTYKMVEVIPEKFWDKVKDRHQFEIMDYLVKMPLWAYLYNKAGDCDDWKVMNMEYDNEVGGKLKKDTDTVLFA